MNPLPENWLDLAASHGATKWVKQFIQTYLPQLQDQTISAQQFATHYADELDSRNLLTPAQQKNYRSNLCQAIKTFDPEHPAIALISPTAEEYRELNDAQRGKLADRETRYLTSDQAQALVDRATELLESAEWSEVGAGLAVLVGRRISEILLSDFTPQSGWSLCFSEMAKKKETDGLTIEVPTLAPADVVLDAIEKLQRGLQVEDLKLDSLSPKMAKQKVNGRYSEPVANRCVEHYSDLVPSRSDRENLYTHIFRAVYATIAAHWYCPPNVPEHNYKAEIQGHFTLAKDGRKLPNYSARANYDDYAIGTEDGNRDGRLGIKLGTVPGLEVIEAFGKPAIIIATIDKDKERDQEDLGGDGAESDLTAISASPTEVMESATAEKENLPVSQQPSEKVKTKRPELHADDLARMTELMAKRGMVGSAAELFHALLETFEAGQVEHQQQQTRTVSELTSSLTWFTDRIDALEKTCQQLQEERDQLQGQQPPTEELNRLRQENAQLKRELQDTQSRLEGIQKFLGGGASQPRATHSAPATATTPIAPPLVPPPQAPSRRNRGETTEKLNQIIDALISWNTSQETPDTQMRISIPTIKALASAMGANYQTAIQEVLRQREEELDEHHSRLLLGTRHNAGVNGKDEVLKAIAQQYLGLDNWDEVKYQG